MNEIEVAVISTSGSFPSISLWNVRTGTLLATYSGGGVCTSHGLVVSDQYVLANELKKPMIHSWFTNNQKKISTRLLCSGKVTTIAISPDLSHLVVGVEHNLHLYQVSSGKLLSIAKKHFRSVTVTKFSHDGTLIACGGEDGFVTIWNISYLVTNTRCSDPTYLFSDHALSVTDIRFTCGSLRALIISVSTDRTCKGHDLMTGNLAFSLVCDVHLTALEIVSTERDMFIGNGKGEIHHVILHNIQHLNHISRNKFLTLSGHSKSITYLSSSVDGNVLLSASLDETVKVWHIVSGQCLRTLIQKGPVTNAIFFFSTKYFLDQNFKPLLKPESFMNFSDNLNVSVLNIHTKQDLEMATISKSENLAKSNIFKETVKLQNMNNELYKFTFNKILGKKIKYQSLDQVHQDAKLAHKLKVRKQIKSKNNKFSKKKLTLLSL